MAKKQQETLNLNKYIVEKGKREIVGKFGEYEVYAPNEEYGKILYSMLENSKKYLNSDNQLEIVGEDFIKICKALTNFPKDLLDSFQIIIKENLELKYEIKQAIACITERVNNDMADMLTRIDELNNMKPEKQKILMKRFTDDIKN